MGKSTNKLGTKELEQVVEGIWIGISTGELSEREAIEQIVVLLKRQSGGDSPYIRHVMSELEDGYESFNSLFAYYRNTGLFRESGPYRELEFWRDSEDGATVELIHSLFKARLIEKARKKLEGVLSEKELNKALQVNPLEFERALDAVLGNKPETSRGTRLVLMHEYVALNAIIDNKHEDFDLNKFFRQVMLEDGGLRNYFQPDVAFGSVGNRVVALFIQSGFSNNELVKKEKSLIKWRNFWMRLGKVSGTASVTALASLIFLSFPPALLLLPLVIFTFVFGAAGSVVSFLMADNYPYEIERVSKLNKLWGEVQDKIETVGKGSTNGMFELGIEPGEENDSDLTSECGSYFEDDESDSELTSEYGSDSEEDESELDEDYSSDVTTSSRERSDTEVTGDMIPCMTKR